MTNVQDLYKDGIQEALRPASAHTMRPDRLAQYVRGKFGDEQLRILRAAYHLRTPIHVEGVYRGHVDDYLRSKKLQKLAMFAREPNARKPFNHQRPLLVKAKYTETSEECLFLFVFPSPEYVKQYADLVVQVLVGVADPTELKEPHAAVTCVTYPRAAQELSSWSGLADGIGAFLKKGDIAVIGHVDLMSEFFLKDEPPWPRTVTWRQFGIDNMFSACIHEDKEYGRAVLLGVRESFWGSAAGRIARALANAGASHVVYAAKMGVLSRPERIHTVMSPTSYYIWTPLNGIVEGSVVAVELGMSSMHQMSVMRSHKSGAHLSVPTVVGETYEQQKSYVDKGIVSIDNEISYIARELKDTQTEFTALHFVTDYVRNEFSKNYEASHDLATPRAEVIAARDRRFREVASLIKQYAQLTARNRSAPDGKTSIVSIEPYLEPNRAIKFDQILCERAAGVNVILSWAEYLPCSLVTADFMRAHHRVLFSSARLPAVPPNMRRELSHRLCDVYDNIGAPRIARMNDITMGMRPRFTHIIFQSDIDDLLHRRGVYADFDQNVTTECVEHLCKLVSDPQFGVRLLIEKNNHKRSLFAGRDSVTAYGDGFCFWRTHDGVIYYTSEATYVERVRYTLESLTNSEDSSLIRNSAEIVQYLKGEHSAQAPTSGARS